MQRSRTIHPLPDPAISGHRAASGGGVLFPSAACYFFDGWGRGYLGKGHCKRSCQLDVSTRAVLFLASCFLLLEEDHDVQNPTEASLPFPPSMPSSKLAIEFARILYQPR